MYMSLNDDVKRKIVNPSYIKEAVQDTFMQRANGDYSYRTPKRQPRNKANSFGKKSEKSSFVLAKDLVQNKVKRHSNDKNRDIRQSALSLDLRDSSLMQLESVKKKLGDNRSNVLDYMSAKRKPGNPEKLSNTTKAKYLTEAKHSAPVLNRVSSLRKNESDELNITPRSIELRKLARNETLRSKKKPLWKMYRPSNVEIGKIDEFKHRKARANVESDRQAILNRIKSVVTPPQNSREVQRHTHSSCFELTPQIYPKGSLSIKKSFLPIEPCRKKVSTDSKRVEGAIPNQQKATETPKPKNIVQKFRGSLTSFFSSLVPSTFK
ncbi:Hypothetical protein NTJ_09821 [Nesidiocoris tenuis]|nr:Hypothetical protein NTJ_09821 [Nesidiocoris tenuis]